MEPEAGIGPATYALRVRCSTTELPGRVANSTDYDASGKSRELINSVENATAAKI